MIRDYFWLTEEQLARLDPFFSTDTRSVVRVGDRRVINGIVHVPKSSHPCLTPADPDGKLGRQRSQRRLPEDY